MPLSLVRGEGIKAAEWLARLVGTVFEGINTRADALVSSGKIALERGFFRSTSESVSIVAKGEI